MPKRLPTVLSTEELRRLFDVAGRDVTHKALLMTLYGSGLRVSEVAALRPRDIASRRMLIHVRLGKGANLRPPSVSCWCVIKPRAEDSTRWIGLILA